MAAERREVEDRRNGHLLKALGMPILAGETQAELARMGEETGCWPSKVSWSWGTTAEILTTSTLTNWYQRTGSSTGQGPTGRGWSGLRSA